MAGQQNLIIDHELEVSRDDEIYLRSNWKLVSVCQFFNLFRSVFKLQSAVTPYDLEQSLLRPQHDPLVADLITRLLSKKPSQSSFKSSVSAGGALAYLGGASDVQSSIEYEEWNRMLAKRFNAHFKNFRKFV